jgi:predicted nuclease with TOPRIM domain
MKFEAYSRRQTQALFEKLAGHATEAARAELDALRASLDARLSALQESLSVADHTQLVDGLIQELTAAARVEVDAARTEAETVAARALIKSQEVADAAMASTKADAQAKIAAEQQENAKLRATVDEMRQQVQAARMAAQTEVDRARAELEAKLQQVQAARAELARVLAETQRDAAAAHAEVAVATGELNAVQSRVQLLEQERSGLVSARDEANARADAEGQRVQELNDAVALGRQAVSQARHEAGLARADAEGRRQALESAMDRIRSLEEAPRAESSPVLPATAVAAVERGDADLGLLDHIGGALQSIDVATSAGEILETVIQQLGQHFARAAVFLVGPSSFRGWRGAGFGPGADISNLEIPRTIDSLLSRALIERKSTTASGDVGDPSGVLGSHSSTAVALPVLANGRIIAVAYAEHAEDTSPSSLAVGRKVAEILIDHADRRLSVKRRQVPPSSSETTKAVAMGGTTTIDAPSSAAMPARQARRIAMKKGLEVTLEGSPSILVDMSTLGAQILSPVAVRPKRIVRLALPLDEGVVVLRGRIVWAQFEQPTGTSEARYRAGLKFTEADAQALETFMARYGTGESVDPRGRLEETA